MIHRLSLAAARRSPALWPAGRRTPPAPASEVAETPSSPEGLRAGSPTRPALRCPPLWETLSASQHHSTLVSGQYFQSALTVLMVNMFQLPPSPRLSIPHCPPATPISTAEWVECLAFSTAEEWREAGSTLPHTRASRCPQLQGRQAPRSSRTRPTDPGERGRIPSDLRSHSDISSYGTSYDSLSLGQSSSGYVNKNYGSDNNQAKTGSSNNTAGG